MVGRPRLRDLWLGLRLLVGVRLLVLWLRLLRTRLVRGVSRPRPLLVLLVLGWATRIGLPLLRRERSEEEDGEGDADEAAREGGRTRLLGRLLGQHPALRLVRQRMEAVPRRRIRDRRQVLQLAPDRRRRLLAKRWVMYLGLFGVLMKKSERGMSQV